MTYIGHENDSKERKVKVTCKCDAWNTEVGIPLEMKGFVKTTLVKYDDEEQWCTL